MNTYLTRNPLGSTAVKDLADNASNFDEAMNSPSPSFLDRFKKRRETWAGMEALFADFIASMGYTYLADYAAGVTFTRRNQYVVRAGIAYVPANTTALPLVLTGNWTTDQPLLGVLPGDVALRSDLASNDPTKGAHLIKWKGSFLDDLLPVWPEAFGAIGDGVANDTVAVQAWLDSLPQYSRVSGKPGSTYRVVNGFDVSVLGTQICDTHFLYPATTATYYHAVRIAADDCKFYNNVVESPPGLTRDATGFGILLGGCDNAEVYGNTIMRTGSAAVWIAGATNFRVYSNQIFYPLADGIHVSDACRSGLIAFNTLQGCHDDALACVGDTPALAAPFNILIGDNIVDGTVAGHGVVLIACDTVIVKSNILRGTANAGVGSYFWQLTGAPVAKDWANNCLIEGNTIIAPSQAPINANNVGGMFIGAGRGWQVRGNDIQGANNESLTSASVIRLIALQDVLIEGNKLHDCVSYGVWNPETNANGALNFTGLVVRNNYFQNIAKQPVRLNGASDMGYTALLGNDFYQCGYDAGTANLIYVSKTFANLLVICGNRNLDNGKDFAFDAATCTNVLAADNTPDILQSYAPAAVPTTGGWSSASSAGSFFMRGRVVYFKAVISVVTKGTGVGLRLNTPKPIKTGAFGQYTGRQNSAPGSMVAGFPTGLTTSQLQVVTYSNADPVTDGATIELDGWYLSA